MAAERELGWLLPPLVRVRTIHLWLGAAFLIAGATALGRMPSFVWTVVAAGMMIVAFVTGRTVADTWIPRAAILPICAIPLGLILAGLVIDIMGGTGALTVASVAIAVCAGNHLKAGGGAMLG